MDIPIIWMMGGPGSGKGTQTQKIVQKYGYTHIDPVELMDYEMSAKTKIGEKFADIQATGNAVPLLEIIPLIEQQMITQRNNKGFVIDGYPANLEEAEILEDKLGSPSIIIALEMEEEVGNQRSSQSSTASRPRYPAYVNASRPVIERYADITLIVNGDQEPDKVFEEIQASMNHFVRHRSKLSIAR
ncbi:adenylate kinase isoenzyme 1-like [Drosophila ficusphila]|uniref:adenylate kinase isoenzyme 1-like n=1 Tax=Drosophila ficusphila TaxID=30025 RepID=UPI0007E68F99|nr:adenylate kinase isoenzyme 1-like [Drosophila ficusphila]